MQRPNILLIFTDQQRADTIHAAGNPVIKTPNLDRLVNEGTTFTSAYTPSPVCVPARCSLIYGQYPHNTGCADNGNPMPSDRPSMMDSLSTAGYRTHGIGKMHFTPDSNALRGFQSRERQEELIRTITDDDYLQFLQAEGFGHVYDPMGCRGEMYYVPQPAQIPARVHATQWVGDRTVEFLRESGDDPFFLFTSFIHPHPPFSPPTPWNKLYRGPLMPLPKVPAQCEALYTYHNYRQNRYKYRDNGIDLNLVRMMKSYYYACISFIDFQVGRILDQLERTGKLDDTLILFASDHGEMLGDYNCFGKRSMLDSAARVPLLARMPKRFATGDRCDAPVSLVDVMPTVLGAADVSCAEKKLDGVDLADAARGDHDERMIFSQYQQRGQAVAMALNRRWKYFHSAPDGKDYLIDRRLDPDETRNRSGVTFCRNDRDEMRGALIERLRADGDESLIEGDGWKEWMKLSVPDDPDSGLLIQDAPWAKPFQRIPGYNDNE